MKNHLLALLLLCCCVTGVGAEQLYTYGHYAPGAVVPVFSEGANLRAFPATTAPVMTRAVVGTPVIIREQDTATYTAGNYTESWYRVRCPLRDGTVMFGYMWGGALAKAAVTLPGGQQLLVGITRADNDGNKICAARVAARGEITAQTTFTAIETDPGGGAGQGYSYAYTMDAERIDTAGFSPALTVVRVGFIYEACDYANGDVLLLWDGRRLGYGGTARRSGNEFGSLSYTFAFPGDAGGQANAVMVNYLTEEYSDSEPPRIVHAATERWALERERLSLSLPSVD